MLVSVIDCGPTGQRFESVMCKSTLTFHPMAHDLVGPAVSVRRHIKDVVPLMGKSRASCPGGRFPHSFIHQVIIITRLSKLYYCTCSRPEDGLRCRQGVKPPLKIQTPSIQRSITYRFGAFEKHGFDVTLQCRVRQSEGSVVSKSQY